MYSDLFLLKNMGSLVKEMNSRKEANLSIKENLLTSATNMVECMRTDPSKVILLKFYLGNTEDSLMLNQSNKNRVLCTMHKMTNNYAQNVFIT